MRIYGVKAPIGKYERYVSCYNDCPRRHLKITFHREEPGKRFPDGRYAADPQVWLGQHNSSRLIQ